MEAEVAKRHNQFRKELIQSQEKVRRVAKFFTDRGYDAHYFECELPETPLDGAPDVGDLWVTGTDGRKHVVEVKGWHTIDVRNAIKHFPHILIDRVSIYDAKPTKPSAYYIIGQDPHLALMFDCKNWDRTFVAPFKHQITKRLEDCYVARPEYFKMVSLF